MSERSKTTYSKVKVDPKIEAKIVSVLMGSGQPFRAVSKTEYFVSKNQCETLTNMNIPYTKL